MKSSKPKVALPELLVKNLLFHPRVRYTSRPRCQAEVAESTQRWRVHANKDMKCELHACYRVGEALFCKRHAGDKLIELLLVGEEVISK